MAKTQTTKSSDEVLASAQAGTAEGTLSAAADTTQRTHTVSLADAIALLDPEDESHWTADGKPRMEVLEALTGGNLTRADVDAAGAPQRQAPVPDSDPEARTANIEDRVAELEADNAFLRKQFGWPKRT